MQKIAILLFILLPLFGLSQKLATDPKEFSDSFAKAVTAHNEALTINHFDPKYRKEQLNKQLKHNTDQFLNELFSGWDLKTEKFVQVDFNAITDFEIIKIENGESLDNWTVHFKIKTANNEFETSLLLLKLKKNKLGFVSAFG